MYIGEIGHLQHLHHQNNGWSGCGADRPGTWPCESTSSLFVVVVCFVSFLWHEANYYRFKIIQKNMSKGTQNSSFFRNFAANMKILYDLRRYEGTID